LKGLSEHTERTFDAISNLDCIKEYVLVGGTALALQIGHRLSEDLDFMKWKSHSDMRPEVNWPTIEAALKTIGEVKTDVLELNHVNFIVEGVRISFYANRMHEKPKDLKVSQFKNNISVADKFSLGVMKVELTARRAKFRDFYDIYALTREGLSLTRLVSGAQSYSGGRIKQKSLEAFFCNKDRYGMDSNFQLLEPKYKISVDNMEKYFVAILQQENNNVS
jgi:hypothetical protein